jgi:hypothetical protein
MWSQLMDVQFVADNWIPSDFGWNELRAWFSTLVEAETTDA